MECKCYFVLFVALVISACNLFTISAQEVIFIQKCKAEDSTCIKNSAQAAIPILAAGIPSLGVDTIDPVTLDEVDSSYTNFKMILTDVIVTGLKDCTADNFRRDRVKSNILMEISCQLEAKGKYDLSGEILNVPIEGRGNFKILYRNCSIVADANMENIKKADGKNYWHIKDTRHTFKLLGESKIEMDSLFDGNETLAKPAREVVDNNTNELLVVIGKPLIDRVAEKVVKTIEQFYSAVPVENLALD